MAINSTGPVSLQDIEDEFGGTGEVSLFEYYRGNNYENAVSGNNTNIPQSGPISMLSFRGASLARYIEFILLGAGGGGGYGVGDGAGSGKAADGGDSSLTISSSTYTASGGTGGGNGAVSRLSGDQAGHNANIADGYSRDFGSSGGVTANNSNASAGTGFAAGGSGGGGDSGDDYDSSGNAGEGGNAGAEVTGAQYVNVSSSISYTLGTGGPGRTEGSDGAAGRPGYVVLISNGTDVVTTSTSGSYTVV